MSRATFSPCGNYRYTLWREWEPSGKLMAFIMLNPSTADAEQDDPTIRRCIQFAKDSGYGRLVVGNLFAYRSTDPGAMKKFPAPIGPMNDHALDELINEADIVVCGWGAHGALRNRDQAVLRRIRDGDKVAYCLKLTGAGQPAHPLYLLASLRPKPIDASDIGPKDGEGE